jgi:hypothetical protein
MKMGFYSYLKKRKGKEMNLRIALFQKTCERVRKTGYYVSPNYGLIMERKSDEYVLADIRLFEKKVVLPPISDLNDQKNKDLSDSEKEEIIEKREKLSRLRKILIENEISPREKPFGA